MKDYCPSINFQQSVWKQNTSSGDWLMHFNFEKKAKKVKKFDNTKKQMEDNNIKLGSLVMTKKGLYRLNKIENNIATVLDLKNPDKYEVIQLSEISLSFEVYIRLLSQINSWYKITLNANGNVDDIKNKLEELKLVSGEKLDYMMIYNGSLLRDGYFFEQLNLKPNVKILVKPLDAKPCVLKRFTSYKKNSYYSVDNLTFQTNKKIKLTGVGLFGTSSGRIVISHIKIIEGYPHCIAKTMVDEDYDIPPGQDLNNCITPFKFPFGVIINPGIDYSVCLNLRPGDGDGDDVYIGEGGLDVIEGEAGIIFTFKKGKNSGVTNVNKGAFPEFYYTF